MASLLRNRLWLSEWSPSRSGKPLQ